MICSGRGMRDDIPPSRFRFKQTSQRYRTARTCPHPWGVSRHGFPSWAQQKNRVSPCQSCQRFLLAAKETPTQPWMPLFWGNNQDSFTTFFSTIWVGHQLLHSSKVPYYPQPKSCSHQGGEIGATMVGRTPVAWSHNSAETPVSWKLPAEKHKFQAKTRADLKWSQGESRRRPKQKKGQEKWECFHPNEGPDHPVGNSKLLTLAISVWEFLIAAAGSTFPKNTLFHIQVPYSKTHRPPKIFQLETYEWNIPQWFLPTPPWRNSQQVCGSSISKTPFKSPRKPYLGKTLLCTSEWRMEFSNQMRMPKEFSNEMVYVM